MATRKSTSTQSKSTSAATKTKAKPASGRGTKTTVRKAAKPPEPVVSTMGPSGDVLRKKELIDKVVKRSGIKKKDAKPVVEAVLAELGVALTDNREMALPPLGKIKINRNKPLPNGQVSIVKVRQKSPAVKVALPVTKTNSGT